MSTSATTRMLAAYIESRQSPQLFLSSFFANRTFHNSKEIEIDVRRSEPYIATPVASIDSGSRDVEASQYENKKFIPPVYDETTSLSAWSTGERQPGVDPFQDPNFREAARSEAFRNMANLEDRQKRAVELQASQVLQTGVVTLKDPSNATVYSLNFGPRPSHFITPTAWAADGNSGDPIADLDAMGNNIRRHGKMTPTDIIFGAGASVRFLANAKVKTRFDNLGLQALQDVRPANRPDGATFLGRIFIGQYWYRLWLYDGFYIDPVTQEVTTYVEDMNVIMLAENARRDLSYGTIPSFMPPDARVTQFLPTRMSSAAEGFDMTTNIWVTPDGKHLKLSVGSRPLCIPTAIDCHGCLTVG